ncbi:MAG: hypothetical protein ABI137_11780 [Antricoccus sp.]
MLTHYRARHVCGDLVGLDVFGRRLLRQSGAATANDPVTLRCPFVIATLAAGQGPDPIRTANLVLGLALIAASDRLIPVEVKGTDESQARFLKHRSGSCVDAHRLGEDTLHAELVECVIDKGADDLGRVSAVPGRAPQPVAQFNLVHGTIRPKADPADKSELALFLDRPSPEAGELAIFTEN